MGLQIDVGRAILDAGRAISATFQRQRQLDLQEAQMNRRIDQVNKNAALQVETAQLEFKKLQADTDIKLKNLELKNLELQRGQAEAARAPIEQELSDLDAVQKSLFQEFNALARTQQKDEATLFAMALNPGFAPEAQNPDLQPRLDALRAQISNLSAQRSQLLGIDPTASQLAAPPRPNQTGTPESPAPTQPTLRGDQPSGASQEASLDKQQAGLLTRLSQINTDITNIEAEIRRNPTNAQLRQQLQALRNEASALESQALNTTPGGP